MELPLYNQQGQSVGSVELPATVFGVPMNADLLYQVVNAYRANEREPWAHTKGRSEVRGGGKKPWRQKGTGRARHGSIRSPIWKGGGVTFGPTKERNFKKKINKKMAQKAVSVALSEKARSGSVFIVDQVVLTAPKTKEAASLIRNFKNKLNLNGSILIVSSVADKNLNRSIGNIQGLRTLEARNLNPLEILSYKNLMFLKDSIETLTKLK